MYLFYVDNEGIFSFIKQSPFSEMLSDLSTCASTSWPAPSSATWLWSGWGAGLESGKTFCFIIFLIIKYLILPIAIHIFVATMSAPSCKPENIQDYRGLCQHTRKRFRGKKDYQSPLNHSSCATKFVYWIDLNNIIKWQTVKSSCFHIKISRKLQSLKLAKIAYRIFNRITYNIPLFDTNPWNCNLTVNLPSIIYYNELAGAN